MINLLITYLLIISSIIGFSQSGKITVRKINNNIVGKTLVLNDLRGAPAGTINFKNDTTCFVHFKLNIKNSVLQSSFGNKLPKEERFNCTYSILNDSLFAFSYQDYQDTCFYKYIDDNTNLVQFKNTLHGLVPNGYLAIFYHFDSILYSQTYYKTQSDSLFTQNIEIDSIYKYVKDKKLKRELERQLQKDIFEYQNNLNFNLFKGSFKIDKKRINLFSNNFHFADLKIINSGINTGIESFYILEGSIPLTSEYTHVNYGNLKLLYDKSIIQYWEIKASRLLNPIIERNFIFQDTLFIKHESDYDVKIFNDTDTLQIWRNEHYQTARIKGIIGGFYKTYYKSLNNKKHYYKTLLFTPKKAFEVDENGGLRINKTWNYTLSDSAIFVYNETDTLIDELTNSWESFSFTYKNNEPFVFGVYHHKVRKNKHIFLILFDNNTGVEYTSNFCDYKKARISEKTNSYLNLSSKKIKKFSFSVSKEHLWLNFENGSYKKLNFFNYNKAIRDDNGKHIKNYYFIQ